MKNRKPHRSRTSPSIREFNVIMEAKALKRWSADLAGCLKFLTELDAVKASDGSEWAKGNRDYYLKRVHGLLHNVPKGAGVVAREARKLLTKLE